MEWHNFTDPFLFLHTLSRLVCNTLPTVTYCDPYNLSQSACSPATLPSLPKAGADTLLNDLVKHTCLFDKPIFYVNFSSSSPFYHTSFSIFFFFIRISSFSSSFGGFLLCHLLFWFASFSSFFSGFLFLTFFYYFSSSLPCLITKAEAIFRKISCILISFSTPL